MFGMICLPTSDDLAKIKHFNFSETLKPTIQDSLKLDETNAEFLSFNKRSTDIVTRTDIDLETMFTDTYEHKILNRKMNDKLKRKQRKIAKKTEIDCPAKTSTVDDDWSTKNVVESCSRRIIGFLVNGDFSFRTAHGFGMGYCSMVALKSIFENVPIVKYKNRHIRPLLFRNTSSRCYRLCSADIVMSLI